MEIPVGLEPILAWAARAVGPRAKVEVVKGLRLGAAPWLLRIESQGQSIYAVLKTGSLGQRAELTTEWAALLVGEENGWPTPRVLAADLTGDEAGALAVLISLLDGSDSIPPQPSALRLRGLGVAAATFHQLPFRPTSDLPLRKRPMPWIDFTLERQRCAFPTTALLERADDLLRAADSPRDEIVFVHGDLWAGNTIWLDDAYVGTVDFEAAGAGSCGVDLGSLRLDAALLYDQAAGDEIVAGWEAESGGTAPNVAFWDITAAANTDADMSGALPTMHQAGRSDLDGPTLTARRDAFLEAALSCFE